MGRLVTKNQCDTSIRMSAVEAAYFAGFVDGEGTITIIRALRKETRTGVRYMPLFTIANSDMDTLLALRGMCGNGDIASNFHKKLKAYHRTVYVLRFSAHQIRQVLTQLLPFLRCKRRQADLLLTFLSHSVAGTWHQRTQDEWNTLERLRIDISTLNQRGDPRLARTFRPLLLRPSRLGSNQYKNTETP